MNVFRIRNKESGLFMTKTKMYPIWTERGSVYNSLKGCRTALRTRKRYIDDDRTKVEIVEYDLVRKAVHE